MQTLNSLSACCDYGPKTNKLKYFISVTMEFQWAEQYPDLLETILQFNLTELSEATNAKYSFQQPLIQNGPQCGLIALAMASACPTNEYVEKIFAKAQQLGYTNKGEIFSCQYMWNLAKEFLDKETKLYEGSLANDSIITFLLADGMLLVPYPFQVG